MADCDLCHEEIPDGRVLCDRCQDAIDYYDGLSPVEWQQEWQAVGLMLAEQDRRDEEVSG